MTADCEVWYVEVGSVPASFDELLDHRERERRDRLSGSADRARLVGAWALARAVLGERVGRDPRSLVFDRTCRLCGSGAAHGKPRLVGSPGVDFSIAHAGDLAVLAVTAGREIGVDVESTVGREVVGPDLERALSESERRDFHEHGGGYADFVVRWTRKEAVLKATGRGLAIHPSRVEVSGPNRPPAVDRLPDELGEPASYTLRDVPVPAPCRAAVAVVGPVRRVDVRDGATQVRAAVETLRKHQCKTGS